MHRRERNGASWAQMERLASTSNGSIEPCCAAFPWIRLTSIAKSLSVNKSRVRTRQVGPSARSEAQPWVAPQGKPSDKAIGPSCPFPKGLTPMRGLLCRPARPWGLPRPSPPFAYRIALGSNASRDLLKDKLLEQPHAAPLPQRQREA